MLSSSRGNRLAWSGLGADTNSITAMSDDWPVGVRLAKRLAIVGESMTRLLAEREGTGGAARVEAV